jgi:hypothetical protein
MAATQSQTAIVTDIREIEMRQFAVPESAQNDAGSIASHEFVFVHADFTAPFHGHDHGPCAPRL